MSRNLSKRGNGEGSVFYREKIQRLVGQVTIGIDNNGKKIRSTFYGSTRKEVKTKMEKLEKELQIGNDLTNKLSIVDLAEEIYYLMEIYQFKMLQEIP